MKYTYSQFKQLLPELTWTPAELAEKLSLAGHETEVVDQEQLDVTLTANRKDCQDLKYLVFDLAGVYGLKTVPNIISLKPGLPIAVTATQINSLLGSKIDFDTMKGLERLGFEVTTTSVTPPEFRDVKTSADVAEEVVRQVGYDKLTIEPLQKQSESKSNDYNNLLAIKCALVNIGLTETATNSFTATGAVEVKDPFSQDEPYLRPSLLTGLLKTLARNPYLKRAAFFEIGSVFTPGEVVKLGVIIAGYKDLDTWTERISQAIGCDISFQSVDSNAANELEAKQSRLSWFEIAVSKLKPIEEKNPKSLVAPLPQFKSISKFPPLVRDVTFDETNESAQAKFEQLHQNVDLVIVEPIDRYESRVTYRLIWQKMTSSYTQEEIVQIDKQLNTLTD